MRTNGTNLMQAHDQWLTRPADQRFWTMAELLAYLQYIRDHARETVHPVRRLSIQPLQPVGYDSPDLFLVDQDGVANGFTHWSFNQLCSLVRSPSDFLRTLPPDLASRCLNHKLAERPPGDLQLLIHDNAERRVRAITSQYERLWNVQVVQGLLESQRYGWMVPPARPSPFYNGPTRKATKADIVPNQEDFGLAVKEGDDIGPAGLYACNENMFIFWINPEKVVDTGTGAMMRGVFLDNSEVGDGSLEATSFYMQGVCGNHIVWDCHNIIKFRYVHRGKPIREAMEKLDRQLSVYAEAPASTEETIIKRAKVRVLGKDREETVDAVWKLGRDVKHGLNMAQIGESYDLGIKFETQHGCPPNTLWGMIQGGTRLSQRQQNADNRTTIDRGVSTLLQLAGK